MKRLDLERYEGHAPGPWKWEIERDEEVGYVGAILFTGNKPNSAKAQVLTCEVVPCECECKIPSVADQALIADAPLLLAEAVALRKKLEYYERLHTLRKKAKVALNLRIRDLRDQLRDERAKSKDYEHNWHLTCTEVKELRVEIARLEKNSRCVPPHIYKIEAENGELKAEALLSQSVIASLRAKLEQAKEMLQKLSCNREIGLIYGRCSWCGGSDKCDSGCELSALLSGLDAAPDGGDK